MNEWWFNKYNLFGISVLSIHGFQSEGEINKGVISSVKTGRRGGKDYPLQGLPAGAGRKGEPDQGDPWLSPGEEASVTPIRLMALYLWATWNPGQSNVSVVGRDKLRES